MSINVQWANDQQNMIHLELQRGWKWNELYTALEQVDDMIASVPQTVHLLIDIRKAGGIPADFMTVAGDMFSKGSARPNEGKKIVVGAGPLIRMAYSGFVSTFGSQLKNRPFLFASNMDEAEAMLSK
jgi:hypothetical protein